MFVIKMFPALSDGAFPYCKPLDWAAPELAQLKMAGNTSYGIPTMIPLISYTPGKSLVGHVGMPILDADKLVFADTPSPYPALS